jgi:hypothetical protein
MPTFSELFCQRHGVEPSHYADAMFRRCLHRRAILFAPLIRLFSSDYFEADFDLIGSVGKITSTRDLSDELSNFNFHPANKGLLRRRLKMRVSGRRLTQVVLDVLPHAKASTSKPPIVHDLEGTIGPFVR